MHGLFFISNPIIGSNKSIREYFMKPTYERKVDNRRTGLQIPSVVYTSEESMKYIKGRDKDYKSNKSKITTKKFSARKKLNI